MINTNKMTQYKECSIVLLPTDKSMLVKHNNKLQIVNNIIGDSTGWIKTDEYIIPQHLYIISDDEIKEGDLTIHPNGELIVLTHVFETGYNVTTYKWYKEEPEKGEFWLNKNSLKGKIIATTNPELIQQGISTVTDEWLQEYCNNPVNKVLVEYPNTIELEQYNDNGLHINYNEFNSNKELVKYHTVNIKDKLQFENSFNTILIKPIEETWEDIFKQYLPNKLSSKEALKIWLTDNYNVPTKLKQC